MNLKKNIKLNANIKHIEILNVIMTELGGHENMAWYDEAIFYHIYPLGMTGAPRYNEYGEPVERLNKLLPWISHIKNIGCNAIYIGPLFE